jgi:hypothetical protein
MHTRYLRWFLLTYVVLLIITMAIPSDETGGVSSNWTNERYSFTAGVSPWSLALAIIGACLYFAVVWGKVSLTAEPMPHLFRRWVAGVIDFAMSLFIPLPFFAIFVLLMEYKRTGVFNWVVERHEVQPSDWMGVPAVLILMFVVMPTYSIVCWLISKPTPGACVSGYRIVIDDARGMPIWKAYLRAILGIFVLLGWPFWILAFLLKRNKARGKFWLDYVFGTHAEFLP